MTINTSIISRKHSIISLFILAFILISSIPAFAQFTVTQSVPLSFGSFAKTNSTANGSVTIPADGGQRTGTSIVFLPSLPNYSRASFTIKGTKNTGARYSITITRTPSTFQSSTMTLTNLVAYPSTIYRRNINQTVYVGGILNFFSGNGPGVYNYSGNFTFRFTLY